jgi:uncharacterized membrane protein
MHRPSHILNAASNLLGIALLVIAGLNVSHMTERNFADKIAWVAAICLSASCLMSYLAIRHEKHAEVTEHWADRVFLIGLATLIGAILVLAIGNR